VTASCSSRSCIGPFHEADPTAHEMVPDDVIRAGGLRRRCSAPMQGPFEAARPLVGPEAHRDPDRRERIAGIADREAPPTSGRSPGLVGSVRASAAGTAPASGIGSAGSGPLADRAGGDLCFMSFVRRVMFLPSVMINPCEGPGLGIVYQA
jgi:hypothetical protein